MFDKAIALFGVIRRLGYLQDFLDKGYIMYGMHGAFLKHFNFLLGEKIHNEFADYLQNRSDFRV